MKNEAPNILFMKFQYLSWLKKLQKKRIGKVKFKNLKKWNQALFQEQPLYTFEKLYESLQKYPIWVAENDPGGHLANYQKCNK